MALGTTTAVGIGALLLGALGLSHSQDQAPPAAGAATAPAVASAQSQDGSLQRRVSGRFTNAPLAEVLRWLGGQGISFVADAEQGADRKMTLSIENQPLKDVLDAIADLYGGRWVRHGSVYTLSSGALFAPGTPVMPPPHGVDEAHGMAMLAPQILDKLQKEGVLEGKYYRLDDKAKAEIEKGLAEAHKALKMDEKSRAILEKGIDIEKIRGLMEKELAGTREGVMVLPKGLSKEDMAKMEKEIAKGMKEGREMRLVIPKIEGLDGERIAKLHELHELPHVGVRSGDITHLMDSLSKQQWNRHNSVGYLTLDDLTQEQRRFIDVPGGGEWSISFVINGKKLNIRSK